MTRAIVLGTVLLAGALSMSVAAWQQRGQGPNVVTVDQVHENLYVLRGGGGNTAVFITSTGVVVVDAKNPGWGQTILDAIKGLTPKPVTTLINTHTHGDHVSGNVEFPASVDVVVQENTQANMQRMPLFAQHDNRGLPKRTFRDRMTLGTGADTIEIYYFGPGHTNGDAWVVFPALRAAHTGDIFAGKGLPLVDGNNGGSVLRYPDTLRKAHAGIRNVDTIINGHSATTTTWDDLRLFAEFSQEFLDWAQAQVKAGRAPAEAAADWKLPARYESAGYSPNISTLFGGLPGRLTLLAEEMKGGR
ncbi:MAG TPA: MBL fold metallo-hydrolase [Vicinamibacterales bacterium]|nr:MBL fold metallo-hydrolase [Vicinamibacterales bacterium]